ncbi:MAG: hypothetical protein JXQ75_16045 [Phycisphaerae bacterium]|nr:hypothetical protein [Phycisphaerae bacterium]
MSSSRETLILQVSGETLRLVQARLVRDTVELSRACSFLSGSVAEDGSALRDETTLDSLAEHVTRNGWVGADLVCVLGGSSVACQYYDMPPMKGDALRRAVRLKLGQQLHFDVADAVVAIDSPGPREYQPGRQIRVGVTAVHKEHARAAVDAAARLGLNVKAITAMPAAITAVARDTIGDAQGLHGILHVDEHISTLVVFDGSSPCVTSELPIGVSNLAKSLMRPIIAGEDIIQLDEEQAATLWNEVGIPAADQEIKSLGITGDRLLPLLEPALQQFAKHLVQWLTFASTSNGGGRISVLRIVGPGAAVQRLAKTLTGRLPTEVQAEHWLKGTAMLTGSSEALSLDAFSAAVGAVKHWHALPDLIPPEVHRDRRIRRIRRSISVSAGLVAAAIAAFAILFDQMGVPLSPSISTHQEQLAGVQRIVGANTQWESTQKAVTRLRGAFDEFTRPNPSWIGIFKELSILLPREVQATELVVHSDKNGMRLSLGAAVYTGEHGLSFDKAVEQALLMLQRSSFFERVELLAANREASPEHPNAAGTLTIKLDLVYPHPDARLGRSWDGPRGGEGTGETSVSQGPRQDLLG